MTFAADRHAKIVIIGGGVIGCSIAYHLARAGETDVLLLEKAELTHGCTWHAAGLVGQLRGKQNLTRLMQNSVAVFDRLEQEAGLPIDWRKVGSLRLASCSERWSEIRRSMSQAKSFGVECHALSAGEARAMFPFIDPAHIEGAAFIPGDGYVDPYALTTAYARVARRMGARIEERVLVRDIVLAGRRAVGVVTDHGTVGLEVLVNAAGLWAKRVGEMASVALATSVVEHQYFLTEKTLDLPKSLPTLRDPDKNFYLKPDTGAFAIGGWEEGAPCCWRSRPPFAFGRELLQPDMERLARFAMPAAERLPILNQIGIQTIINGPIPVSADGEPILGPAPELDNLFVACGFTAGIAASGGAGQAIAGWILEGDPGMDLWSLDVRRFGRLHAQDRFLEERAQAAYASYYKLHRPGEESTAGRDLRRSPLHDRMAAAGAVFGAKFGWERPNFFASPDRTAGPADDRPSFEDKPGWFEAVGEEHRLIRERAALIDQSSFAKFLIEGPGALAALQRIAANDLAGAPGKAVYTQLCSSRGGIEADVTLIHEAEDRFLLVTGAGFGVRDGGWVRRHLPTDGSVRMQDVTSALAVLNLCGPASRTILQAASDDDLSNEALPFLAARRVGIGQAEALAVRIGYVGELGYELYLAPDVAVHVLDTLLAAGAAHGLGHAGYKAIESCRLEKGYLYWSGDIGPDDNPYEAGLGFCVALDKGEFIGSEALRRIKRTALTRQLRSFAIDGFAPLHGGEPILHDGRLVGFTTSAGFGYTVGRTIAFGYVPAGLPPASSPDGGFAIEAFGRLHPASHGPRCRYDPKMKRLKA